MSKNQPQHPESAGSAFHWPSWEQLKGDLVVAAGIATLAATMAAAALYVVSGGNLIWGCGWRLREKSLRTSLG